MILGNGGHASVIRSFYKDEGGIVAIGDNATRKRVVLEHEGMRPPMLYAKAIHPSAIIAEGVPIGIGTVIMAGVILQTGARIGRHVILNTGCVVDHDCVIGDYAHIPPGAHLCGGVEVGEGALVGVGVGIAPGCKIPAWSLVKAARLEIVPLQNHG
jgi:acetyltransferase EpsM